jgi:uncharacterized iron-regulated membrane protein
MRRLNILFRNYHRQLSIVTLFPILLIVLTGISLPILESRNGMEKVTNFVLKLHAGRFFGSDIVYCTILGLSLLGLLVTGLSMTGLFPNSNRRRTANQSEETTAE